MNAIICLFLVAYIQTAKGKNLLLNKPSTQSSTFLEGFAEYANDGNLSTVSKTSFGPTYWQGDLQALYPVQGIAVTPRPGDGDCMRNAFIGVSTNPNTQVTVCGQWPDKAFPETVLFTCEPPGHVRYVKIWLEQPNFLMIAEVEVYDTTTTSMAELNLMLNKPSTQSSDLNDYNAELANDGSSLTASLTTIEDTPFWQGDLQEYFHIHSVAIMSNADINNGPDNLHGRYTHLKNASIAVTAHNISNDPNGEVAKCGEMPDLMLGVTVLFRCDHPLPVRFIRIWRESTVSLALGEVIVHGTPPEPFKVSGMKMKTLKSTRVTVEMKTIEVNTPAECANTCFMNRPCIAFSFNKLENQSCILSTSSTVAGNQSWVTYEVTGKSFCP